MGRTGDIRAALKDALFFDPVVDSSDIRVGSVGGDVALSGTVPSYRQYLEAAAAACRVAGVTSVRNDLEVVLPPGDRRSDRLLAAAAGGALGLSGAVPGGVGVTARDGAVTLAGVVRHGFQRAAAVTSVAALSGVRSVRDDIEVSSGADPAGVAVAVRDALGRAALVPGDGDVAADADGSAVTLTGHVR